MNGSINVFNYLSERKGVRIFGIERKSEYCVHIYRVFVTLRKIILK